MNLSDFANKRFAVYGLGFNGNNIKVFDKIEYPCNTASIEGYNIIDGKKWGKLIVVYDYDGPIFFYNQPDNHWHKKWLDKLLSIQKLKDKDFHWIDIQYIPEKYRLLERLAKRDCLVIEATAYWGWLRLGRFWLVEIVEVESLAIDHCIPYVRRHDEGI